MPHRIAIQKTLDRLTQNHLRLQVEMKTEISQLQNHAQVLMDTALQQWEHSPGLSDVLTAMWRDTCTQVANKTAIYLRV